MDNKGHSGKVLQCRHCVNVGVAETMYGYWLCMFHLLDFINKVKRGEM